MPDPKPHLSSLYNNIMVLVQYHNVHHGRECAGSGVSCSQWRATNVQEGRRSSKVKVIAANLDLRRRGSSNEAIITCPLHIELHSNLDLIKVFLQVQVQSIKGTMTSKDTVDAMTESAQASSMVVLACCLAITMQLLRLSIDLISVASQPTPKENKEKKDADGAGYGSVENGDKAPAKTNGAGEETRGLLSNDNDASPPSPDPTTFSASVLPRISLISHVVLAILFVALPFSKTGSGSVFDTWAPSWAHEICSASDLVSFNAASTSLPAFPWSQPILVSFSWSSTIAPMHPCPGLLAIAFWWLPFPFTWD
jgi:hypothetical protein